ncbi:MAG: hypothetical protein NT075_12850 [Chloroflexi bacterium]|nr:hypothetical protein [Chloroflexota bacterium]
MTKLKDEILLRRMDEFFGYGRYDSKYWFIGMEEGGGNSIEEVEQRLTQWLALGASELVDNYKFHKALDSFKSRGGVIQQGSYAEYFEGNIKTQPTWRKLIRMLLNIEDPSRTYEKEAIKDYQAHSWGQSTSNNCLLDVFPLPSPDVSRWEYDAWSELDFLRTRESYKSALRVKRVAAIRNRIVEYAPKVVTFYSFGSEYIRMWEELSGCKFEENMRVPIYDKFYAFFQRVGKTLFIVTGQPAYIRSNEYWDNVGKMAHKILAGEA